MPVFHRLLSQDVCEIVVRCHPLENPADFVQRWLCRYGRMPSGLRISKGDSLDKLLSRTDVALMFRSTVMIDCVANKIPVIMPGWIDFGFSRDKLLDIPCVYFADDFIDLENRIHEWLKDPPQMDEKILNFFVQPPRIGREQFRAMLKNLVFPKQG